jgi:hypothetical protein
MRWIYGFLAAGALLLVERPAGAQNLNSFGGYPAGITTGSSYGFYPGGYAPTYSTYSTPAGAVTMARPTYYTSGYYGGTPGTVVYRPGVNLSSPNAAAYGYSAPVTKYRYVPNRTYTTRRGWFRRGLFGRRANL